MSDTSICYAYDRLTGEFTGEAVAHPSPLEPGAFLPPAFTTPDAPPALVARQAAVFAEGAWRVVADRRGEVWYKGEAAHVVNGLGDPSADGLTPAPVFSLETRKKQLAEQVRAATQAARDAVISPARLKLLQFDAAQASAIPADSRLDADRAILAEFDRVQIAFARIERGALQAEIEIEELTAGTIDGYSPPAIPVA